jgi:hypothetical protein
MNALPKRGNDIIIRNGTAMLLCTDAAFILHRAGSVGALSACRIYCFPDAHILTYVDIKSKTELTSPALLQIVVGNGLDRSVYSARTTIQIKP